MKVVPLEQCHRDAMLDLILAWGTLDGALGMLLSTARGLPLDQGAARFGRSTNPDKLDKLCKWLRELQRSADTASKLERHIPLYRKYSESRNCIAHAKCMGADRNDADYIVFLKFQKHADGELLCLKIHVQEMWEATRWAEALSDAALKIEELWRSVLPHGPNAEN